MYREGKSEKVAESDLATVSVKSDKQRFGAVHKALENAKEVHIPSEFSPNAGDSIEATEDGIARELVRRNGREIRFDNDLGAWFVWGNGAWRRDAVGIISETLREIIRDASSGWGDDKELRSVRRASFVNGAERMAKTDQKVSVIASYWDRDPLLLGCPNVTIDLRTGLERAPSPDDGITKLCGTAPKDGSCPTWIQFLMDTTGNDEYVIEFIQMWFGYLLTGLTDEQVLLFIYGPGGNGKSVFLNTITRILGDYSSTAAIDTFTKSRGDRHPTDLAMLYGARSVSVSETEEGRPWAEARIKQLTGGDKVTARFMRKDFFTFLPTFKLTIVGNHPPVLSDVDPAIRRRFLILPFTRQPNVVDIDLEKKLWEEAPQILAWATRGCLELQKRGLARPEAILAATNQYFEDQDLFSQWLEECCEISPANSFMSSAVLYQSWRRYAEDAGEDAGTQKMLGHKLKRNGLSSGQKRFRGKNCKGWLGISLV